MIIDNLISGLKTFEAGLNGYISEVIRQNETLIIELNSEEQLYEKGITRDGVSIDSYAPYSEVTIEIKQAKGQPTGRVTLRDEGDFEKSFFIDIKEDSFEIKASDGKTEMLTMSYGSEILGLTDENLIELVRVYILPVLLKKLREI
ncbi:MAG: hypothetical protein HQ522_07855 [Bacteroidetes bacterium]|nr:hypothetical protein [Bacteroidota bacterium]